MTANPSDPVERMRTRITQLVSETQHCKVDPSPELQRLVRVMLQESKKLSNTHRWRITEMMACASWLIDQLHDVEGVPSSIVVAVLGQIHNPAGSTVVLTGPEGQS